MSNHGSNHAGVCARTQSRNHATTQKACKDAITGAITSITRLSITSVCVTKTHDACDGRGQEEGEEMSYRDIEGEREWYVVSEDILNKLWATVVPRYKIIQPHLAAIYIDHLDRYVDMGVLSRSGAGTRDDPIRYQVVFSPLGTGDRLTFIGYRPRADVLTFDLAPDDVPTDLLRRVLARDAR
jgi:hypothetical protein